MLWNSASTNVPNCSAATALKGITLVRPEITVVRGEDKRWDVEDLLKRKPAEPSRFTGDVVIQLAQAMEGSVATAFPWVSYQECLEEKQHNL